MVFISWNYIARYINDKTIYSGYQSCVTSHALPSDEEHFELFEEWTRDKTCSEHGFTVATTTIICITQLPKAEARE